MSDLSKPAFWLWRELIDYAYQNKKRRRYEYDTVVSMPFELAEFEASRGAQVDQSHFAELVAPGSLFVAKGSRKGLYRVHVSE